MLVRLLGGWTRTIIVLLLMVQSAANARESTVTGDPVPRWLLGEWRSDRLYVLDATPQLLRDTRTEMERAPDSYIGDTLIIANNMYFGGAKIIDYYKFDLKVSAGKVNAKRFLAAVSATRLDYPSERFMLNHEAQAARVSSSRCRIRGLPDQNLSTCGDLIIVHFADREGIFTYDNTYRTLTRYTRTAETPRTVPATLGIPDT